MALLDRIRSLDLLKWPVSVRNQNRHFDGKGRRSFACSCHQISNSLWNHHSEKREKNKDHLSHKALSIRSSRVVDTPLYPTLNPSNYFRSQSLDPATHQRPFHTVSHHFISFEVQYVPSKKGNIWRIYCMRHIKLKYHNLWFF